MRTDRDDERRWIVIRRFFHGQQKRPDETGTSPPKVSFKAGDLLSVLAEDGQFGVMKVLVIDDNGAHVRLYGQRFSERPQLSDLHELSVVPISPEHRNPFSFGHMPFLYSSLDSWEPQVLGSGQVSEEELAGYHHWLKENGGYF